MSDKNQKDFSSAGFSLAAFSFSWPPVFLAFLLNSSSNFVLSAELIAIVRPSASDVSFSVFVGLGSALEEPVPALVALLGVVALLELVALVLVAVLEELEEVDVVLVLVLGELEEEDVVVLVLVGGPMPQIELVVTLLELVEALPACCWQIGSCSTAPRAPGRCVVGPFR